jgi:hypothetical protein
VEHARALSSDGSGATLRLLARGFDAFSLASSGLACEFDRESDAWTLVPSDVNAGTRVAGRLHRTTPRERVRR